MPTNVSKRLGAMIAAATCGAMAIGLMLPTAPAHAITVFDPSNYAQNILTAARTLRQVNQQIQQLQNEAQMLVGMRKNLSRIDFPQLEALRTKLSAIDRLMGEAQGIDFRIGELDTMFARLFPREFSQALGSDQRIGTARERLDASMAGFRQTMSIQAQVVANVHDDMEALADIAATSQGAEGALQVAQATNQLLALSTKQQLQLQQMMAAQFRSDSQERARLATQALEARAATRKFLGSGSAYTPR